MIVIWPISLEVVKKFSCVTLGRNWTGSIGEEDVSMSMAVVVGEDESIAVQSARETEKHIVSLDVVFLRRRLIEFVGGLKGLEVVSST